MVRLFGFPFIPRPHQGVLQKGQLILFVADVFEQTMDEARRHRCAADGYGVRDGLPQLLLGQARNQVLAFVDGFGQILKLRTFTEIIRAHRQHDVDIDFALLRGGQQQADELCFVIFAGFVFGVLFDAEQFFKLIGNY
ncbi:MAG: hypothetical protein U0Y68_00775 [Blastocatellia bacterium]